MERQIYVEISEKWNVRAVEFYNAELEKETGETKMAFARFASKVEEKFLEGGEGQNQGVEVKPITVPRVAKLRLTLMRKEILSLSKKRMSESSLNKQYKLQIKGIGYHYRALRRMQMRYCKHGWARILTV